MLDLKIYPLTCDKYIPTRVKTAMGTWASGHTEKVIFLGDRDIKDQETGSLRQLDCMSPRSAHPALTDNPYEDAPHKLFNAFRKLADSEYGAEWMFFCDDDTYVKVHLLEDYVKTVTEKYGSNHISLWGINLQGQYEFERSLSYPSGGAGYLVNRSTLQKIVPHLDSVERSKPDSWGDVMLGFAMQKAGVNIIDDNVFYDLDFMDEWREWQWSRGKHNSTPAITYHYMTPEKMLAFYGYHMKAVPYWYIDLVPGGELSVKNLREVPRSAD